MSKNDDRILELKEQIKLKKEEITEKNVRFRPVTNCILEFDGKTYNLNVLNGDELKFLLIKLNTYCVSADQLKISVPELSGYPISSWIDDVLGKINVVELREEKKKLEENERLLERLLSEDKKTELMLDDIAASLK